MEMNTNELRKLAEAATPGPWRTWFSETAFRVTTPEMDECPLQAYVCKGSWWFEDSAVRPGKARAVQNAAYIAAANPATILALLDELDAARAALRWAYEALPISCAVSDEDEYHKHAAAIAAARGNPQDSTANREDGE